MRHFKVILMWLRYTTEVVYTIQIHLNQTNLLRLKLTDNVFSRFGDFSVPNHINENLLGRIGHHFELDEFVKMLSNRQFGKYSYNYNKPGQRRATEGLSETRKNASHYDYDDGSHYAWD